MKHRSDFVTNSSSANYILQLGFGRKDGTGLIYGFSISPESAGSEDGWVAGEGFEPDALAVFSVAIDGIKNKKKIDDIVDEMAENIDVVYCGTDHWDEDGYDEDDDGEDEYFDEETYKSLKDVYPKSLEGFKKMLNEQGFTVDNISTIVVEDCKEGGGDSAMYVNLIDLFGNFMLRYEKEDDKEKVINDAVEYIRTRPMIEVHDNEYMLDDQERFEWTGTDEDLRKEIKEVLESGKSGHRNYWMLRSVNREELKLDSMEQISEKVVQVM